MNHCERCGVDTVNEGWCEDCLEVEGTPRTRRSGPRFTSSQRQEIYAGIREYAAMGIPRIEIAEHYGVHHHTVWYAIEKARVAA